MDGSTIGDSKAAAAPPPVLSADFGQATNGKVTGDVKQLVQNVAALASQVSATAQQREQQQGGSSDSTTSAGNSDDTTGNSDDLRGSSDDPTGSAANPTAGSANFTTNSTGSTTTTSDDLAKQMVQNDQYQQQVASLTNSVLTLSSQITELQQKPDLSPSEQTQLQGDMAALKTAMGDLNALGSTVVAMIVSTSSALAGLALDNNSKETEDKNDSASPTLPASSSGGSSDVKAGDGPNLFLATGLMAIMFKAELGLVHQAIQNMDAERKVKQEGFENYQAFAKENAGATYSKDMDQANIYENEAVCSFVSAGISLGMGALTGAMSFKAIGESVASKQSMVDNPEYQNGLDDRLASPSVRRSEPEDFLPEVTDKDGGPVAPGLKQIDSEIQKAKDARDDWTTRNPEVAVRDAAKEKAFNDKITKMENERNNLAAKYKDTNVNNQMNQKIQAQQQLYQSLSQGMTQTVSGIQNSVNAGIQMKLANDDAAAVIASAAMQIANQYLQSAMEAFSGEGKNVETLLQFLMSASSKNTQWSSIRA